MDFFFFIVLYTVLFFSWKILQKIIQFLTFQPPPIQPKFYFSESCELENKVRKMRVDPFKKIYLKTDDHYCCLFVFSEVPEGFDIDEFNSFERDIRLQIITDCLHTEIPRNLSIIDYDIFKSDRNVSLSDVIPNSENKWFIQLFLRDTNFPISSYDENGIISPYELDWNKVFVIKTEKECAVACSLLFKDCVTKGHVLGFDCEWCDPGPVAIIQLASFSGFCSVFQLILLGEVPSSLQKILSSKHIYKVGVEPYKDARRLEKDYDIQVCGTIDLRFLLSGKGEGLSALCKNVLGIELDKELRRSNWKSKELTKEQVYYAAKDAFVATQLYQFKEFEKPELFCDTDYSSSVKTKKKEIGLTQIICECKSPIKEEKKKVKSMENFTIKKTQNMKTIFYDNCFMYSSNGQLLCSCSERKVKWYLAKGLAKVIQSDPLSIQLNFLPKVIPGEKGCGKLSTELKKNCCVVCGLEEKLLRFHVVPKEYM